MRGVIPKEAVSGDEIFLETNIIRRESGVRRS